MAEPSTPPPGSEDERRALASMERELAADDGIDSALSAWETRAKGSGDTGAADVWVLGAPVLVSVALVSLIAALWVSVVLAFACFLVVVIAVNRLWCNAFRDQCDDSVSRALRAVATPFGGTETAAAGRWTGT